MAGDEADELAHRQKIVRMGDGAIKRMVDEGDPFVKAFYGSIQHAAGQVDGLLNLWEQNRRDEIEKWLPLKRSLDYTRDFVTRPILQGTPPTSNSGEIISVREARILLQGWIVIGMVCEGEYANYLASNSKDPEAFRYWFEYAQDRVSVYLTGHRDSKKGRLPPKGEPRTAAAALYALVHDVANHYVSMTQGSVTN